MGLQRAGKRAAVPQERRCKRIMDKSGFNDAKEFYKKGIMEMIESVENAGTLEYLNTFIRLFLEKWG